MFRGFAQKLVRGGSATWVFGLVMVFYVMTACEGGRHNVPIENPDVSLTPLFTQAPSASGTPREKVLLPRTINSIGVGRIALLSQGNKAIVRTKDQIVLHDIDSQQIQWSYSVPSTPSDYVGGISVSPNGQLAAATMDKSVYVFDTLNGDVEQVLTYSSELLDVEFSPDNTKIAASTVYPGSVVIWSKPSWKQIQTLNDAGTIHWMADSRSIIILNHRQIHVWNIESNQAMKIISAHEIDASTTMNEHFFDVTTSNDGILHIAETINGLVILWNDEASTIDQQMVMTVPVSTTEWSLSATYLALGRQDGKVILWDIQNGARLTLDSTIDDWVTSCKWASNDSILACVVKDRLAIWQVGASGSSQ